MNGTIGRRALGAFVTAALGASAAQAHLSIIRQGPESAGVSEAGDQFGFSFATGDFNGDGYDDLATGAPTEDVGGTQDAGAVVINFGSEYGLTHVGADLLTRGDASEIEGTSDQFGYALAAADLNRDGYDDLVVGVPGATIGGHTAAGRVIFFRGGPTGLSFWVGIQQTHIGGADEAFDRFGASLAVGHLNEEDPADPDVVIGAPGEDGAAGIVFYILGTAGGPFGQWGWFKQDMLGGANEAGDQFGYALATGNVRGTSLDEILVGAPFEDLGGVDNAGVVYVIPTVTTGPTTTGAAILSASVVDATSEDGWFGFSLATGVLTFANGFESLAVGEPGRTHSQLPKAGRVIFIPGSFAGFGGNASALTKINVGGQYIMADEYFGHALAAGDFDERSFYDDLAVSTPRDWINGLGDNSGKVFLLFGGANGPNNHGTGQFNQFTLGDPIEGGELLGTALAFGEFDGSDRAALVAGAVGEDASAGQVHVIAPWRQIYDLYSKNAIGTDCAGNILFSQKAFDEVPIASTTKIMTVLLACERSQLPPGNPLHVNLDTFFAVPNWVVDDVLPTDYLVRNEIMSLRNLLYVCLMQSANDAAYLIGDVLTGGGGPAGIPTFVAEMNARAASLGMTNTLFTNAAGFEKDWVGPPHAGENHSTARDMAVLGRVAMQNPVFREIAETAKRTIVRDCTDNSCDGTYTIHNIVTWVNNLTSFPEGNGIKSGYTQKAQLTAVVSAETFSGDVVAASFGTPNGLNAIVHEKVIGILEMGLAECGVFSIYIPHDTFQAYLPHASTFLSQQTGLAYLATDDGSDAAVLELCRDTGTGTTSADVVLSRTLHADLGPSEATELHVAPFHSNGPLKILNAGDAAATILVGGDGISNPEVHVLQPGDFVTFPGHRDPAEHHVTTITNQSAIAGVTLAVEEEYWFQPTFLEGLCTGPQFSVELYRAEEFAFEQYELRIIGTDPTGGSTLNAVLHDGSAVIDVPDILPADGEPIAAPVRVLGASPNPLRTGGLLRFDVGMPGAVRVDVFDLAGRRVRAFDEAELTPGSWKVFWDGRNEGGVDVASGHYFYRVVHPAGQATGRIVVAR